jgi:hypothetical protein
MPLQTINVGLVANDGTGDDLREAFIKVNENFDELDLRTESTTAVNVGTGAEIFKSLDGSALSFKTLTAGNAITITENANDVQISSLAGQFIFRDNADTSITTGAGTVLNVDGRGAAVVTVDGNTDPQKLIIDTKLKHETTPELGGNLNARFNSIFNLTAINGNIPMNELEKAFGWDFGEFDDTRSSIFDFILNSVDVDFGTLEQPSRSVVDFGAIGE